MPTSSSGPAHAAALTVLRRHIEAAGEPGRRLPPERELAATIGVGRRALRQALDVLEGEGVVWRRQGQGTFVGSPQPEPLAGLSAVTSPVQLMEVRLAVEPVLARLAAIRASRTDLAELEAAAARVAAARGAAQYELADTAFHRRIAATAGNPLFLAMFDMVVALRRQAGWTQMRAETHSAGQAARFVSAHADILSALARTDPDGAEAAMRRHLREVAIESVGMDPSPSVTR